jgi:acetylornithine deacetylase
MTPVARSRTQVGSKSATIDALRALVGFDTTSRQSNLAAVNWICERLHAAGARIRLTHDDTGAKANILAVFGPECEGGIVLSGHTDCVPVDGQTWSNDPFALTEFEDGRLHGRGTSDMKGFVAAVVALAPRLAELPLHRPVVLALSYDEEVGCLGIPRLLDDLLAQLPPPAAAIIGEPTGMRLGLRHRGFQAMRTRFTGRAAHSGAPERGASAILAAATFALQVASLTEPPDTGGARTTTSVGLIRGGSNINIVPAECELEWEIRAPTPHADAIALTRVAAWSPPTLAADVTLTSTQIVRVPALDIAPHSVAASLARWCGALDATIEMPFGTEAGFFHEAGIPAVVCGPGDIAQAHLPDEWIEQAQLFAADSFLDKVALWACRGREP